jgi:hypothetical protein
MTEPELFVLADHALLHLVEHIKDEQWLMVMPSEFQRPGVMMPITLREIITQHAYDDAWVPTMLAGHTIADVGEDTYKGDLLENEPKEIFADIVARACEAALQVSDLTKIVHCSFGDYSTQEYFWQIIMFRGLRAYDLAKVIGIDPPLSDELVQELLNGIAPRAEKWREMGIFGPKIAVPESASLLDRLLGLTGRTA